jgi:hypothetical protein
MSLFDKKEITAEDVNELFASRPTAHLGEHHFTEPEPILCKQTAYFTQGKNACGSRRG